MTALLSPHRVGASGSPRLQAGWLLPVLITGFPVWWFLGLGELIFVPWGLAALVSLFRSGNAAVPRNFGLFGAFVVVVAVSGVMLPSPTSLVTWGLRLGQYVGVGMILPYALANRSYLTAQRVLRALSLLWLEVIGLGVLAVILGPVSFPTPMELVLPDGVLANSFVREQVHPSLADVHNVLGFESVRSKAPFTYTNGWGAAVGLLFPVALYAALVDVGIAKRIMRWSIGLALVPIVLSLNRGLWLSMAVALAYGGVLAATHSAPRTIAKAVVGSVLLVAVLALSPLGGVVASRIETPHSNAERGSLYVQVLDELKESPVVGFGAPRATDDGPPLGTHGQLWIVLFSHGVLGAILYFGYLGDAAVSSSAIRSVDQWPAHVVLIVALVQVFFYGHVPQQFGVDPVRWTRVSVG